MHIIYPQSADLPGDCRAQGTGKGQSSFLKIILITRVTNSEKKELDIVFTHCCIFHILNYSIFFIFWVTA